MLIITTPNIEGHKITKYHGMVSGQAILGANAVIGVDLDFETITLSRGGTMMMVSAAGTAVNYKSA